MPDNDYDELDEAPDQEQVRLKSLRDKAAKVDRLEPENTSLRTENALLKAGLGDLNDLQQKALIASHEGDLTPEALKATAATLGFTAETKEEAPQVSAEEQAAHARVATVTTGASASGEPDSWTDRLAVAQQGGVAALDREISELNEALKNVPI